MREGAPEKKGDRPDMRAVLALCQVALCALSSDFSLGVVWPLSASPPLVT